ncbi:2TM domain-containing protein [Minwuia sp.]|uniref:2TM domain-containing protein n=1 Tax=Minwuia sp. TaxID=2493630 RepID=UPI003A8E379E
MIVRKLRLDKGWSQETLAEVSGLSVRTVQRVERGGQASLETLNALASVLETDVKTLSGENSMTAEKAMTDEEADALEYVREIKGFYFHLMSYVFVIALLFFLWLIGDASHPWFFWPAFGWGMGVAAHWIAITRSVPLFGAHWERQQVEKQLAKQRKS